MVLFYIGLAISLVGFIMMLIAAFNESVAWGLGCLLLAPVGLIFVFTHWHEAKNSFFLQLIGFVIIVLVSPSGGVGVGP